MEREIQHELGYDIPVMTVISCQGNINHFNIRTGANQTSYAEACRIGKADCLPFSPASSQRQLPICTSICFGKHRENDAAEQR